MRRKLDTITIQGFKSIQQLEDFPLGDLNVLIGANGAGKSNFVEFFRLIREIVHERLQRYAIVHGPSDGFFFNGVSYTKQINSFLRFGSNAYKFTLSPSASGGIFMDKEYSVFYDGSKRAPFESQISAGSTETMLKDNQQHEPSFYVWSVVSDWSIYHFHDTTMTAGMRRDSGIEQTDRLRSSGENLSACNRSGGRLCI